MERARGEAQSTAGSLQSLCWGSSAAGGLASAYFSGSLVQDFGTRAVFLGTALFPLLTAAVAPLVRDSAVPRVPHSSPGGAAPAHGAAEGVRDQALRLWSVARQRAVWAPALFIFLWQATPSAESAFFFYTTDVLKFEPEFYGRVRLATSLAMLLGVGLYNGRLKAVPLKTIFLWTSVLGAGLSMTKLVLVYNVNREWGVSDQWFALCDSALLTVLGQVAFMPTLVLAARICPEGVEATLFAALMSVFNAAGVAGGALGAGLTSALGVDATHFENLGLLVTICNLSQLVPLPFLYLLDGVGDGGDRKSVV